MLVPTMEIAILTTDAAILITEIAILMERRGSSGPDGAASDVCIAAAAPFVATVSPCVDSPASLPQGTRGSEKGGVDKTRTYIYIYICICVYIYIYAYTVHIHTALPRFPEPCSQTLPDCPLSRLRTCCIPINSRPPIYQRLSVDALTHRKAKRIISALLRVSRRLPLALIARPFPRKERQPRGGNGEECASEVERSRGAAQTCSGRKAYNSGVAKWG